jgi:hypothetical protein
MNALSKEFYVLGHRNFGQLTTHVPHAGYGIFTDRAEADRECEVRRKLNPKLRVLIATQFGTPCGEVSKSQPDEPYGQVVIWGLPKGETERWKEQILSTQCRTDEQQKKIIEAATADGWHSFRVSKIDSKPINWGATVNP